MAPYWQRLGRTDEVLEAQYAELIRANGIAELVEL
jgi:hypothetical protein